MESTRINLEVIKDLSEIIVEISSDIKKIREDNIMNIKERHIMEIIVNQEKIKATQARIEENQKRNEEILRRNEETYAALTVDQRKLDIKVNSLTGAVGFLIGVSILVVILTNIIQNAI